MRPHGCTNAGARRPGWVPQPTFTVLGAVATGVLLLILAAGRYHAAAGTVADQRVLAWMVAHRTPRLTSIATTITTIGSPGGVARSERARLRSPRRRRYRHREHLTPPMPGVSHAQRAPRRCGRHQQVARSPR